MRTFIKTAMISTVAGAALILAAAPANAAPSDDYDYASGAVGESCAGQSWGKLALDRYSGIVLTCTDSGAWQIPKYS